MNEEIKEILDKLKDSVHNPIVTVFSCDGTDEETMGNCQCLEPEDCKILLDYITNLQEENEHLDKVNCHLRKKINNDIYKSRNEKAIDFIEEKISSTKGVINDYMYHKEHNKILIELLQEDIELYKKELNILTGGDKE